MKTWILITALAGCILAHQVSAQVVRDGNINLEPRYGGVKKSRALRKLDEQFLAICDKENPDRKVTSAHLVSRGWEFLRQGDVNTAIKRFNQAWLLDSTNVNIYWGFGAVTGMRHDYSTSLAHFQTVRKLDPSNTKVMLDVSQTLLMRYEVTKQLYDLDNAISSIQVFLDDSHDASGNFQAYEKMAAAYLFKGDYPTAWKYVDKATVLNPVATQSWELLPKLQSLAPR